MANRPVFGKRKNSADILAKCALCNGSFDQDDFVVLEEQEQRTTFHVTCGKCGTSSLVFLSANPGGAIGLGIATDLGREEAIKMFGQDAVSADEVIDAHQMMAEHKGSLADLMKKIN